MAGRRRFEPAPGASGIRGPRRPSGAGGRPAVRVLLLALGGVCLLAGLDAALLLTGSWAPSTAAHLPGVHGMVMVLGFLGTVISLERAQALGRSWAYLAPAVLGAGGVTLALGLAPIVGKLLLVEGCVLLVAVYVALWRRAPLPIVAVQVLSAVTACAAAALWLVTEVSAVLPLLAAFLVLTIASERAELAQLAMGAKAAPTLVALATAMTLGAVAAVLWPDAGARVFGATVVACAAWLVRDDVARTMLRADGLRRYNAAALLAGYLWLAVAGATWLALGEPVTQPAYDTVIHATFLGFGLSMVMAHAPIIFPAVIGRALPYRPVSWVPLVWLHGSLAARIVGGLAGSSLLWRIGSVGTVTALLLFLIVSIYLVVTSR